MAKAEFSPSLMCMDLLELKEQVAFLNGKADFYHVDIMDGHFVKNITLSPDFVRALSRIATKPIDCHLMVTNPEDYVESLAKAGAGYITPHAETLCNQAFRMIGAIRDAGCKVGVAVSPATPLGVLESYLHLVDKLTIMTVDPGFAGQPFIREMLDKIALAARLKAERGYTYKIEVDGSCNVRTYKELYAAGVQVFILGSSGLFGLDASLPAAWEKMCAQFAQETGA